MKNNKERRFLYLIFRAIFFSKQSYLSSEDQKILYQDLKACCNYEINPIDIPNDLIRKTLYRISNKDLKQYKENFNKRILMLNNGIVAQLSVKYNHFNINEFVNKLQTNVNSIIMEKLYFDKLKKEFRNNLNTKFNKFSKLIQKEKINTTKEINSTKDKIYTDLITILGIFVAIMVAIFGGFQLFGSEFSKNLNFGHATMIGSIILFGTYLILLLLFDGVAKLRDKSYHFSIPFNIYLLSSFLILFLLGTIACSIPRNNTIYSVIRKMHYYKYTTTGITIAVLIILGIIIFNIIYIYHHYKVKNRVSKNH